MKRSIDDITSSAVLSGSTVTERKVSVGRHMFQAGPSFTSAGKYRISQPVYAWNIGKIFDMDLPSDSAVVWQAAPSVKC